MTGVAVALAVSVALWLAGGDVRAESSSQGGADVSFVASAFGVTVDQSELRDRPDGEPLAVVPGQTIVAVGGVVRSGWLWLGSESYWVQVDAGPDARFGFLAADEVDVVDGAPPALEIDGIATAALVHPAHGVTTRSAVAGGLPGDPAVVFGAAFADALAGHAGSSGAASAPALGIPWLPPTVQRWEPAIVAAAASHGVDPDLVAIITLVESGGNPAARSPSGARGLMQVMPATGADIARQRGMAGYDPSWLDDPETNIDFGVWYITRMLELFGTANDPDWLQSVSLAAAAYNGGPGSVQQYQRGGALPAESARYRDWVGRMWSQRRDSDSEGFRSWLAAGGSVLVGQAELVAAN
jgi:hypothetical protein